MRFIPVVLCLLLTVGMAIFPSRRALVERFNQGTSQESDTAQIKRLRFEQTMAQLDVNYWHRELRPFVMSDHPPAALLDSLGAARTRLDLATRALNRFMQEP